MKQTKRKIYFFENRDVKETISNFKKTSVGTLLLQSVTSIIELHQISYIKG